MRSWDLSVCLSGRPSGSLPGPPLSVPPLHPRESGHEEITQKYTSTNTTWTKPTPFSALVTQWYQPAPRTDGALPEPRTPLKPVPFLSLWSKWPQYLGWTAFHNTKHDLTPESFPSWTTPKDTNASKRWDDSHRPKTWNGQRQHPGKFLWKLFLNSSSQSPCSYLQTAKNIGFCFRCLWKTRDKEQFWANPIDLKLPMKISFLKWQEIQWKNRLQKEQVFSFQLHKNTDAVDTNSWSASRSNSYIPRNGLKLIQRSRKFW